MPKVYIFKETEECSSQQDSQVQSSSQQSQDNSESQKEDKKVDQYSCLDWKAQVSNHNSINYKKLPQQIHSGFTYPKATNSYIMKKCLMPELLCRVGEANRSFPTNIILMIQNEKQISRVLFQNDDFQFQRLLTLYIILFNFKNCSFDFKKKQGQIVLTKRQSKKQLRDQKQHLKGWFEWVINQISDEDLGINQKSCHMEMNLLARRQVQKLALHLTKNGELEQAEFITNIEDQFYRLEGASIKISHKFQRIKINDHSDFDHYHWIIRMGTLLWYFFEEEKDGEQNFEAKLKKFLTSQSAQKQKKLKTELLFLKLYYKIEIASLNQFPNQVSDHLICYYWYYLTKIPQEYTNHLDESLFLKAKYFIVNKIIKLHKSKQLLEILFKENPQIKANAEMAKALSRSVTLQRHSDSTISDLLSSIKQYFEDGEYVKCLSQITECIQNLSKGNFGNQLKGFLLKFIEQIIVRPQIICSYREGESRKALQSMLIVKDLLKAEKNALSKEFHDILFYLQIKVRSQTDPSSNSEWIQKIASLWKTAQRLKQYERVIKKIIYSRIISDKGSLIQVLKQKNIRMYLQDQAEQSEEGRIFKVLSITSQT